MCSGCDTPQYYREGLLSENSFYRATAFASRGKSWLVLGLYRKRDGARRLHEHGVLARFRYNDLKEAARAADAGLMQIQWWEGAWPSCAEAVPQSATRESI